VRASASAAEYEDLLFGWWVEQGITSNSVIFVKDGCTVGIGTGEQDRVGWRRSRSSRPTPIRRRPVLQTVRHALQTTGIGDFAGQTGRLRPDVIDLATKEAKAASSARP